MQIRNERGGITVAEGCIFGAVALFALLLIAMLVIAFFRFSQPPDPQNVAPRQRPAALSPFSVPGAPHA